MKKAALVILVSFLTLAVSAQNDTLPEAPYKRFPGVPPFKILLADSSYFSKEDFDRKKAVLLVLFSPDCEHCQHLVKELVANIDDFKKVQIMMVTMLPFERVREFVTNYGLEKYKQLLVGKDANYMLPEFYRARSLPFLAFYNRKKQLISVKEGGMDIPGILAELQK